MDLLTGKAAGPATAEPDQRVDPIAFWEAVKVGPLG